MKFIVNKKFKNFIKSTIIRLNAEKSQIVNKIFMKVYRLMIIRLNAENIQIFNLMC